MIKKYVKGNASNPEGVIKALEELGGVNGNDCSGWYSEKIYFINDHNIIAFTTIGSDMASVIIECFEEIQPIESKPTPKIITELDVAKWYFTMINEGHAVQFLDRNADIHNFPENYSFDSDLTDYTHVRVDYGEWIPIEEAGII